MLVSLLACLLVRSFPLSYVKLEAGRLEYYWVLARWNWSKLIWRGTPAINCPLLNMKPSFPTFYLSRFTNKVNCAAMAVPPHVRPIKRKRERDGKVSYTRAYLSIIPHKSLKLVWSLEVRLFCLVELTSEVALKTSNYCIGGHRQQTYNGSGFNVGWIRDIYARIW
jgi:hypothetical protein